MSQTATPTTMVNFREGQIAQGGARDLVSGFAEAALKYGLLLQRGASDNLVKPMDALPSADVDAFVTAAAPLASATSPQVFNASVFNGVVGGGIVPGYSQRASFTLNNHGDWDDTVMKVCYENEHGVEVIEDVVIPNSGNVVLYTTGSVSILKYLEVPAQTGTNGTITIGQEPTQAYLGLDPRVFLGVGCYAPGAATFAAATEVATLAGVNVMRRGRVAVVVEKAVAPGAPAYARVVLAGTDVLGQFQGEPDTNFIRVPGAHFVSTAGINGLAVLQLGGVA